VEVPRTSKRRLVTPHLGSSSVEHGKGLEEGLDHSGILAEQQARVDSLEPQKMRCAVRRLLLVDPPCFPSFALPPALQFFKHSSSWRVRARVKSPHSPPRARREPGAADSMDPRPLADMRGPRQPQIPRRSSCCFETTLTDSNRPGGN
jgi:hypothetical protein